MSEENVTKVYEPQEPHSAEDCKINETPHNHPDCDCGHSVATGPATGKMLDDDGNLVDAPSLTTGPGAIK